MGVNTSNGIPYKLKREARELWGYNCVMCGTKAKTDLAHTSIKGENPYYDTEPINLLPLCKSCHRKADTLHWDSPFQRTLRWIVKTKADLLKEEIEEHLDGLIKEMKDNYREPFGDEKKFVKENIKLPDSFKTQIENYIDKKME